MKLLFIFYIPSGGMDTLNRERCDALKHRGLDCHLLYLQRGSGLQNNHDIPVHITNEDQQIAALLAANPYTAIIVTSHYLMLPRLRSLGYSGPLIYEAQGLGTIDTAHQVLASAKSIIEANADAALFPVTKHLDTLFQLHLPNLRKYSFHNCINANRFSYQMLPKPRNPIIGWVGRIEANKNWRQLLEMMYWIRQHIPAVVLWIFVDDTLSAEQKEFDTLVKQLKLESSIKMHTNIPHHHMAAYYSQIGDSGGFLLSTSITEGFGYAVAEAMCCRCPVLSTDSDGVRSMIIHDDTGRIYNGATDGVEQGLALLREPALRSRLRRKAERHIRTHFAPDKYAEQFVRMLQELRY